MNQQFQRPTNYFPNYITSTLFNSISSPFSITNEAQFPNNGDVSNDGSLRNEAYCKPFVVVDVIWNIGFVFVSGFVLIFSYNEVPVTPLRVWIFGYSLLCVFHVFFVWFEFRTRNFAGFSSSNVNLEDNRCFHTSIVKKLESANTIASSFWWVFGFYWIVSGGQALLQDAPHLYWLVVVFLALDVFFMILCVGMACLICLALFCCIPVVAIVYAMTIRGASEEEIKQLPRYRFSQSHAPSVSSVNSIGEQAIQFEDPECCICLTRFMEGAEICTLPCKHDFHYGCIRRWLQINAICPLCKYNIKAKGDVLV